MNAYPVLYSFRRCPYAMRTRMVLRMAGIQCEIREVVLKDKPQAMLDISPKGTVPVLQLPDGRIIDESFEIMCWALAVNDPEQCLCPENGSPVEMLALIRLNDSEFKFHLDRYKYPQRFGKSVDAGHHFSRACEFLAILDSRLNQTSFLFGAGASLADVALFPFVRQFASVDPETFGQLSCSHVQYWLGYWLGNMHFLHVMKKFPQWHVGDNSTFLLP
ncbi:MAG: glutathione S-transferase [Mariprofundus sp.]|nr:glutathione S-transferase [Mariprofundus sp.]